MRATCFQLRHGKHVKVQLYNRCLIAYLKIPSPELELRNGCISRAATSTAATSLPRSTHKPELTEPSVNLSEYGIVQPAT
jgi:hypothetical protein